MAKQPTGSTFVGRKNTQGGGSVAVYKATVATECERCHEVIPVGAFFTRGRVSGGHNQVFPYCTACRPLKEAQS
ncbi:MAG TPA: hypothetical protein VMV29_08360 [Ktedonobacterales bacterium]|nr:hypothetical protein [Ktedonobacterales bacterium]